MGEMLKKQDVLDAILAKIDELKKTAYNTENQLFFTEFKFFKSLFGLNSAVNKRAYKSHKQKSVGFPSVGRSLMNFLKNSYTSLKKKSENTEYNPFFI